MITITHNEKNFSIHIQGHDNVDEVSGKSLLCNSVSILFYSLCYNVSKRCQTMENLLGHKVWQEKGDAYIEVTPESYARLGYSAMFDWCMNGFRMLQEEYPERVKIVEE